MPTPEALGRSIEASGFLRRSAAVFSGQSGHKEWLHFSVYGDGVSVLLNFSLADDVRPGCRPGTELARVTCLVRDTAWDGDVDTHSPATVCARGGGLDARFGESSVEFSGGAFRVRAKLKKRPIEVELRLRPLALPSQSNNVVFEDCPPLSWLVVPRLAATGTVKVGDRLHAIHDAPSYHDHNWGYFRWGKNFVWEWGYGVPGKQEDPFSVVFVRFMERGHLCDLMQGLLVWQGARQARIFRGDELRVRHEGLLSPRRIFRLPRAMSLVAQGTSTDVPKRLLARAEGRGDHVELVFEAEDLAQIITPNDDDLGVTVINEVTGHLSVEGRIHGERVLLSEPTTFEFLSG
jgi:hypothetical protein